METARKQAPEVIRTFMRVRGVTQQQLGEAIGLTQTQLSRRLAVPGSLSHDEMVGLARVFGVSVETFYKPLADALADLFRATPPPQAEAADTVNEAKGAYLSRPDTYQTGTPRRLRDFSTATQSRRAA